MVKVAYLTEISYEFVTTTLNRLGVLAFRLVRRFYGPRQANSFVFGFRKS